MDPNYHPGSWTNPLTGQPITDRGWTEKITDALGFTRTSSGGSDLVMDQYQNPNTANLDKSGGYQLNPVQQAQASKAYYSGNVAGASKDAGTQQQKQTTNNTPSGGVNQGNLAQYFPGYAGWDSNAAWADYQATGGAGKGGNTGGGVDFASLISDMYAPALNALTQIEGSLGANRDTATGNTEKSYGEGKTSISNEQKELETSLADQSQRLEKSGQSAFAEAVRNLNSLFQGLASRFGAGSLTGLAAGELMGQEFLRNQGKMREQLEAGRQQIGAETTKMKNYIADKVTQLDQWKRDAIAKINENFTNSMNEIAMRRGDIEANKTKDRVALLQDAVNRARDVETRAQEFKMGLAQFATEQLQSTTSRNLTPAEIAGVVNEMLGQNISSFQSNTVPGYTTANPYALSQKQKDELSKLNILG